MGVDTYRSRGYTASVSAGCPIQGVLLVLSGDFVRTIGVFLSNRKTPAQASVEQATRLGCRGLGGGVDRPIRRSMFAVSSLITPGPMRV